MYFSGHPFLQEEKTMRKYHQLTSDERYTIGRLKTQGFKPYKIAEILGRHPSAIYREFQRNSCWVTDGAYRPSKAERRTRTRRSRSRRNYQYTHAHFELPIRLLKKRWSPEQIVGHIRRHQLMERCMSHETLYLYIWQDMADGGDLWQNLRQSNKQRRKRYKAHDSRGRLANKRSIEDRPAEVEDRQEVGHWEIDTVMGKGSKDCLLTLAERASGVAMIGKLRNRTTQELNRRCIQLIKKAKAPVLTITADNGTEFHQYRVIEKATGVRFYFAHPYHSWERGTNENTNGLIRQYFKKGESLKHVTQQQCNAVAKALNNRPRKRHGFKTPNEVLYG